MDLLEQSGHAARAVAASDALSVLRAEPAELVLLDPQTSGEAGWRLCGELQNDSELNDLPVMMLGGPSSLMARVARQRELDRLRQTLNENRILLQETHHRVKNNLQWVNSVLFLQAAQLENREVAAILEATQGRVRSMALIHDALYRSESLASLSFREYLEQLCQNLWDAFAPRSRDIELQLSCPHLQLDVDRTATCGLLVNELVTNAFKHAFRDQPTGRIVVHFAQFESTYSLSVRDSGTGRLGDDLPESVGTMGLQLIRLLTAKLRGQFSVLSGDGWGVGVEFPRREPGAGRG